jgi:hypothetical protein
MNWIIVIVVAPAAVPTTTITSAVNFYLFGIQVSGILMQPAKIWKKIYHFYKATSQTKLQYA